MHCCWQENDILYVIISAKYQHTVYMYISANAYKLYVNKQHMSIMNKSFPVATLSIGCLAELWHSDFK